MPLVASLHLPGRRDALSGAEEAEDAVGQGGGVVYFDVAAAPGRRGGVAEVVGRVAVTGELRGGASAGGARGGG